MPDPSFSDKNELFERLERQAEVIQLMSQVLETLGFDLEDFAGELPDAR